jgi:hypothetical protein
MSSVQQATSQQGQPVAASFPKEPISKSDPFPSSAKPQKDIIKDAVSKEEELLMPKAIYDRLQSIRQRIREAAASKEKTSFQ